MEFQIEVDNQPRLIRFSGYFTPSSNGGKSIASGVMLDITGEMSKELENRKLAEEQQKEIEKKLNEANLTKDKFFSIIAHDLRSPFTSILGFSRLLNEEYDDFSNEERKMMIKQILTSTETTFQLLDNLLAWAKTQLGRTSFTPEYFDIDTLIFEAINLSLPQAKIKGVALKAQLADKNKVYADINMMRTVLRNLLSNAIKYSYDRGTIIVETLRDKQKMTVSIIDSGTGIEINTLKALFSLDEKVCSKKGTANEKGTGLGLILCKEFVERNHGEIFVQSELGSGTRFSFTIPLTSSE
jgi:signal transduction histidine kinase